jgi:crossover junction endodeoxyribonuclease RuvC
MILGIDCGLTGALALVDGDECRGVWDMPTVEKTHGKGQQISASLLSDIVDECIKDAGGDLRAVVERVAAMPGQGVSSMFAFGRSVGVVEGVCGALGLSVRYVTPQSWKRSMGLLKAEKDASRTLAIELFPEARHELARKKDVGRADALLIGLYGQQTE